VLAGGDGEPAQREVAARGGTGVLVEQDLLVRGAPGGSSAVGGRRPSGWRQCHAYCAPATVRLK